VAGTLPAEHVHLTCVTACHRENNNKKRTIDEEAALAAGTNAQDG
jgi:hypothetical protein